MKEILMKIDVEIKKVYGNSLIYPVCDKAVLFARLARTSTLTPQAIDVIKRIGFTINVINNQVSTL